MCTVFLQSPAHNNYDARANVTLRCIERQIVNMFSHLRASTSVDALRIAGVEKMSTLASAASMLLRRTNQKRLFLHDYM